ncbi:hypothetical protein [Bradyrhizobium sp. USDA 3262]|nr:hypothetical protein QIH80_22820 [Bradyrhizobium elkanii]
MSHAIIDASAESHVRVVAPHFVASFESDGVVRRAAPIIKYLVGKSDDQARQYIKSKGWKASIIPCSSQSAISRDDSAA